MVSCQRSLIRPLPEEKGPAHPPAVTGGAQCLPLSIKGVDLRFRRADNPDYDSAFNEASKAIYERITSGVCPSSVRVE